MSDSPTEDPLHQPHDKLFKAGFETRLQSIQNTEARHTAMTLAQRYRQEGRQEGLQKGLQKGRQEDVIEALEIRFGSVPEGLQEAIRQIDDESHLRLLLRSAIQCADLEALSAVL